MWKTQPPVLHYQNSRPTHTLTSIHAYSLRGFMSNFSSLICRSNNSYHSDHQLLRRLNVEFIRFCSHRDDWWMNLQSENNFLWKLPRWSNVNNDHSQIHNTAGVLFLSHTPPAFSFQAVFNSTCVLQLLKELFNSWFTHDRGLICYCYVVFLCVRVCVWDRVDGLRSGVGVSWIREACMGRS